MSGTNITSNKHVSSSKDERQMLALFDLHNLCDAGDCEERWHDMFCARLERTWECKKESSGLQHRAPTAMVTTSNQKDAMLDFMGYIHVYTCHLVVLFVTLSSCYRQLEIGNQHGLRGIDTD